MILSMRKAWMKNYSPPTNRQFGVRGDVASRGGTLLRE